MSIILTWNTTKHQRPISFQCLHLIRWEIPPHFAGGISGGWGISSCWGENEKETFWSNKPPLLSIQEPFVLCRPPEWKFWFLLWADLRGWGTRGCLLPAPSFPLLCSSPSDFPLLHPLGRGKWNLGSVFWPFQLILTKDPFSWSFLTQQRQIAFIPGYSSFLWAQLQIIIPQFRVKNEANCFLIPLPQR